MCRTTASAWTDCWATWARSPSRCSCTSPIATSIFPAEGRAKVVAATKGHKLVACYNYDADHAFARVGGIHWDGRCATIANGRSAEALVKALG